jgi:hypothetical protein
MSDKINKKIAEIKSRFGCGEPVYSKIRWVEEICLFLSRWKYRLTGALYFKIKYFVQRLTRGYDNLDKWNAAWYIARKAIPVLKAMRNEFHGTSVRWHREDRFGNIIELTKDEVFIDDNIPDSLSEDEWRSVLDDIIFAFEFTLDLDNGDAFTNYSQEKYENNYKRQKRGLKLFSIYYMNLWD